MRKIDDLLAQARSLARASESWADLSNAIFDPMVGLISKHFPDAAARDEFYKSDAYNVLHSLVEQKMRETGVVEGSVPQKSGRFVVRLPRSMHAALEREAAAEGTSLNQLVLAKLATQLSTITARKRILVSKRTPGTKKFRLQH